MEVLGTRFGRLTFDEEEIIRIKGGLFGFPESERFVLFPYENGSAFFWFQSIDEPEIAFIVVNPFDFVGGYEVTVGDDDVALLGVEEAGDVEIFTLVTVPEGDPAGVRTNLSGPVAVNVGSRIGKQLVLTDYSSRQPLLPEGEKKPQFIQR